MRRLIPLAGLALIPLAACEPSVPEPVAPSQQALSCDFPVNGNKDTASTILDRFGKDAERATLNGPEGVQVQGIVLWKNDPRKRLDLILDDESPHERIFGATVSEPQSQWRIAGVGLGDPLTRVTSANASQIGFWGFGWDYGGYITDFGGGALADPPGGCEVSMRLSANNSGNETPTGLLGEVQVKSGDPRLQRLGVVVSEMGLNWR
jgi:hypothetical protein